MDKRPFLFLILALITISLACGLASTATPEPSPIPTITVAAVAGVVTNVPVMATETAVLPTAILPEMKTAVPTPEPTAEIVETETETAVPVPVVSGELFAPGQKVSGTLAAKGEASYLIDGVKFTPRFAFVETTGEIDLLLAVNETEANFSGPGGPEVLVITADENGRYDLIVRNQSQTEGDYTLYLFDAAQAVPGAVHQPNVTLTAAETKQFQVESRGGRPVLIFVDPLDQSDISITITTADGQTVAEANYSGPGSAEAAFLRPLQTTRYTITVREINNAPSQINVLLVPLE